MYTVYYVKCRMDFHVSSQKSKNPKIQTFLVFIRLLFSVGVNSMYIEEEINVNYK